MVGVEWGRIGRVLGVILVFVAGRWEGLGERRLGVGIGWASGSTRQRRTYGRLPPEADVPHHEGELGGWIVK